MKNIFKFFSLLLVALLIVGCSREDEKVYDGDKQLHFLDKNEVDEFVLLNTNSKDVSIPYGTMGPVTGNHTVKLVVDAANSTAVEGTDFTIVKGTDELSNGENGGEFEVRINEPAFGTAKKVVFKISSTTLPNAVYNQSYVLNWKLQCMFSDLIGSSVFENTGWWLDGGSQSVIFELDNATNPTKIFVRNFFEPGLDLTLSYDAATSAITVDDQFTGMVYTYQGTPRQVWVRQRPSTSNTADFCNRELKLETQYYLKDTTAAFTGDTSETFVGL